VAGRPSIGATSPVNRWTHSVGSALGVVALTLVGLSRS
jgi:hypothetical protein